MRLLLSIYDSNTSLTAGSFHGLISLFSLYAKEKVLGDDVFWEPAGDRSGASGGDRRLIWFGLPGWSASTLRWRGRCRGGGPENRRGWPPHGPCHGSQSDRGDKRESLDHVQAVFCCSSISLWFSLGFVLLTCCLLY